ncbi:hypothetical protein NTGBS_490037 [Candidatus Nitrotoga sp. BS]|nr:hypothetical protein NTGBS_490037 [Candidatus Nitrotoga sp. BS]
MRDEANSERYVEYIHYNPVKHDYAASPLAWSHSSFLRYVGLGFMIELGAEADEF